MAKKILHECDNCKATGLPDPEVDPCFNAYPRGWVRLQLSTNGGKLADLTLCSSCEDAIKKALLKRA